MKLTEVVIFTNRVAMAFDERGMQHEVQGALSRDYSYDAVKAIKIFLTDKPVFKISRWQKWIHNISIEEFCLLFGWYRDYLEVIQEKESD